MTSFPTAFLAEKPLVHVRRIPDAKATCSTGKEKVKPRWMVPPDGEDLLDSWDWRNWEDVRNASTESAR
jgi:hypothetical protein